MSISQNYPTISPSLDLSFALTKKLDPRITFARASTGAYYDGQTVAKAEENLFTYSQEFDNGVWTKTGASITANATTAPDGTGTADLYIPNTTLTQHRIVKSFPQTLSGNNNISFYLKGNGYNFVTFYFLGGTSGNVQIDLTDGSTSYITPGLGADFSGQTTVTAESNGFYRVSISLTSAHTSFWIYFYETVDTLTFAANGVDGIYIWGAQLEQRSAVTAYTPTTTQPITNYIPVLQTASANVARFDHNPVTGESLGLLVEEQRTNLLTYSEDFSDAAWTKSNSTITANTIVAPDGTLTGDALVFNTTNIAHYLFQSVTLTATTYTFSCYAKYNGQQYLQLGVYQGAFLYCNFDILNGTVGTPSSGTAGLQDVGDGWYRCSFSVTGAAVAGYGYVIGSNSLTAGFQPTFTGDGYSGIYIWGAQLEVGAFPTSYIPTVASQVTRSADAASMTGTNFSDWFNPSQGAVYADYKGISGVLGAVVNFRNSAAIFSNVHTLFARTAAGSSYFANSNNVAQVNIGTATLEGKAAFAYQVNDFAVSNSGNIFTDTLGILPVGQNQLFIGTNGSSAYSGTIKKLSYYSRRLTNEQLQALTS
jgi:hypothetical protein